MKSGIGMALAFGALTAVLGFFVGHNTRGDEGVEVSGGMRGSASGSVSRKSLRGGAGNTAMEHLKGANGRAASPEAALRAVIRKLEGSPMIGMDYDTMFDAYAVIREMSSAEVRAALAELERIEANPQVKMTLQMLLVNHWAKKEGRDAMEYVMENSDSRMKSMGVMGGVMAWMREEPDAAYEWFQEHKNELGGGMFGGGGHIEAMMIATLSQRDMAEAFEKVAGLPASGQQTALMTIASQVGMDPEKRSEFLEHIGSLDDEAMKRHGVQGLISSWAWQDPEGAAEFIANSDFDETARRQMKDAVAQGWAFMDPEGAMEWSMANSEGEDRVRRIEQSFANWVQQNPESAEQWLRTQPEDIRTDGLYSRAGSQLMSMQNYDKAIDYINRIENDVVRLENLRNMSAMWKASGQPGRDEWLETLDAPLREEVLDVQVQPGLVPWAVPDASDGRVPMPSDQEEVEKGR